VVGRQSSAGTEVALEFPATGALVQAVSVDIGEWAAGMDIALLELTGDLPPGLVVPEWLPYAGATDRVRVFGYPLEERELNGIWVQAAPAGLTASGLLQIDATGAGSSLRGHSGGPVVDATTGAVIGVLVEGSAELRFDRGVPIELLARHCPRLGAWWMFAGDDTRDHFRRRATGQRSIAHGGDLFRGRATALERIRGSIAGDGDMPLVVTGQPGAGKSAVLARAALAESERAAGAGLAFHARGQGVGELIRAVARVVAVPAPARWQDLVDHLAERLDGRLALFVDALDEMATDQDIADAVRFLRELSRFAGVSVTVATRWRAPGGDRRVRDLPGRLGAVAGGRRDTLVDLDTDRYFDASGLLAHAEDVLCQRDVLRPGPGGAAWEEYRRDPALRRRLSQAVARRADRNHLVAAMSALELSESDDVLDPRRPGFDERRDLPGTVGQALDKYLDRLPGERRQRTVALLVALAYAEGSGLTDDRWRAFTEALGYARPSLEDLDALRTGGAADYLLQTTGGDSGRTTRLFHQALADHLREGRDARDDQRRLASCLVAELPDGDWSRAPDYLREHGPAHLAAGGLLDEHLTDVRFLLAARPERLIRALPAATSTAARQAAHVYELAFHHLVTKLAEERPAYLQLAARCAGQDTLAAALTEAVRTSSWRAVWARWRPTPAHRLLGRHGDTVWSVAVGQLDGGTVVVSGSRDGAVRVWRLDGGGPVGQPWRGHEGEVHAVALSEHEGGTVVVSGGEDGTMRVWQLDGGAQLGTPWRGHKGRVNAVAVGELEGRPVVVSGGEDGTVRVWRLDDGTPVGKPWRGHEGWVNAVAVSELEGRPVVISCGDDKAIRVWRLDSGAPVGEPWCGHDWSVDSVTVGKLEGRPVVVSGSEDGTARVWRLDGGAPVGEPLRGHDWVRAVALAELDGHLAVVSGGEDGTVRAWRVADQAAAGEPWHGHDWVRAVAAGEVAGDPTVVSAGEDGTVRVWRLESGAPVGEPWRGHDGWIRAMVVGELEGRPIVVSGGVDSTVRVWGLDDGSPLGEPRRGHDGVVWSVAMGDIDGHPVVASGGEDGTVRVWPLVVSVPPGEPWRGHEGAVRAVAVGKIEGCPVVVSGGSDGTVRVWELAGGAPLADPWRGQSDDVWSVAVGELEGRPVVVSGDDDGMVRVRQLDGGAPVGGPWCAHEGGVSAVAVGVLEGRLVVVSGGWNGTIGVRQPADGGRQELIDLGSAVRAVAFASPRHVVAGTAMGIVVLRLGSTSASEAGP
jgi:WD40 repeat protein